ncbi:glutathione S-transferase domain-containing protein [Thecamonas trahens ATCC 50062]|uniref:Glutathione S-transferase domain-containing protein n=1 Tax=Thecamonas trahens ATCC 50062 TaxID=461836 RepID=A0A0L0DF78_THETB|nr:glutathione S-transferase domain-containing protein [Thecamonas trahens ATCC 50062]KNC50796.1 glutathione S-transferase domain-containing protein [Thecamonas trahens ATCC 50062]|eukprot:XP_013756753.1 glutathione S-transferase domain-containing protein [Thecamonas trahens ATCC 50062]
MRMQTLYTYPNNSRAFKALVAAQYGGVEVETDEFLALNPLGKVPTLKTPEGGIFESSAIAAYVARAGSAAEQLLGATVYESSLIDSWIQYAANEIDMPRAAWLYPLLGYLPYSKAGTKQAKGDIKKVLGVLNAHLESRTYLVGNAVSLADIIVACTLLDLYKMVLEPQFRAPFEHTNRWFTAVVTQPEFVAAAGETTLCEKMAQYDANKMKKAKEASKAAAKGKQEDAFASLPPSSFDLAAFKREYSNKDARADAIPYLWSNFDNDGYSFWFCEYKYNSDLTLAFKASNIVGRFMQRLPNLHDHGFASMLITGSDGNLEISGVWLVRGKELPQHMLDNGDFNHYTFTPLDVSNDEHKTKIEDYLAWDGASFEAKGDVVEGKVYK